MPLQFHSLHDALVVEDLWVVYATLYMIALREDARSLVEGIHETNIAIIIALLLGLR